MPLPSGRISRARQASLLPQSRRSLVQQDKLCDSPIPDEGVHSGNDTCILQSHVSSGVLGNNHPVKALIFDRPDKSFSICIQIRASLWRFDHLDTCSLQDLRKFLGEKRIPIMNNVSLTTQESADRIGEIAAHLFHPLAVCLWDNSGDFHFSTSEFNSKQHHIACQSAPRVNFNREEVNRCQ
jgi:hypothetical protein